MSERHSAVILMSLVRSVFQILSGPVPFHFGDRVVAYLLHQGRSGARGQSSSSLVLMPVDGPGEIIIINNMLL